MIDPITLGIAVAAVIYVLVVEDRQRKLALCILSMAPDSAYAREVRKAIEGVRTKIEGWWQVDHKRKTAPPPPSQAPKESEDRQDAAITISRKNGKTSIASRLNIYNAMMAKDYLTPDDIAALRELEDDQEPEGAEPEEEKMSKPTTEEPTPDYGAKMRKLLDEAEARHPLPSTLKEDWAALVDGLKALVGSVFKRDKMRAKQEEETEVFEIKDPLPPFISCAPGFVSTYDDGFEFSHSHTDPGAATVKVAGEMAKAIFETIPVLVKNYGVEDAAKRLYSLVAPPKPVEPEVDAKTDNPRKATWST